MPTIQSVLESGLPTGPKLHPGIPLARLELQSGSKLHPGIALVRAESGPTELKLHPGIALASNRALGECRLLKLHPGIRRASPSFSSHLPASEQN
jgi:hypothetical protein